LRSERRNKGSIPFTAAYSNLERDIMKITVNGGNFTNVGDLVGRDTIIIAGSDEESVLSLKKSVAQIIEDRLRAEDDEDNSGGGVSIKANRVIILGDKVPRDKIVNG
jgi:hypothetical protein